MRVRGMTRLFQRFVVRMSQATLRPAWTAVRAGRLSWGRLASAAFPCLVLAGALIAAVGLYTRFLGLHRHLWDNPVHDRNAHYLYALRLASDLRHARVFSFLAHVNQAGIWPPLHGVLAAAVLLVGGLDHRLAVLPSLAGWVGTVVLAFLVGRRVLPRGGTWAGLVAALFVAASPAHRAYATDIMLESVGACLTLAVLYLYLRAVQSIDDPAVAGRRLGLALTALFLHKYNYWLLVVLALAADQAAARWRALRLPAAGTITAWLRRQTRRPSTVLLLSLVGLVTAATCWGPRPVEVAGLRLSVYPPNILLSVTYGVFSIRVIGWWRASGRQSVSRLDPRVRGVVYWHAWPAAVWLLLPGHAGGFLWYLGPGNAHPGQHISILDGVRDYSRWLVEDYHVEPTVAAAAAALCLLGLLSWRRCAPGGAAVLWLVVLGACLTVTHPNHKGRNLHSWLAAAWVAAGVGLAAWTRARRDLSWGGLRPWLGVGCLAALAGANGQALLAGGHALEGGPHLAHHSFLDVTDTYVPDLAAAGRATVLAAAPVRTLTQWALFEWCGGLDRLEEHWYGFGDDASANRDGFNRWLAETTCDTIVFVGPLPGQRRWEPGPECDVVGQFLDPLRRQKVFHLARAQDFAHLGLQVFVWKRGR
jgi:hypothetical protein